MATTNEQLKKAADTIRCLCADMIDAANSGHPGAPLGMADLAVSLWINYLNFSPADPKWPGRDRLVFSGGHASSLLYALHHLAGTGGLGIEELKSFRQIGSRCAGHPERGLCPGVEVTTGPLGQGLAMAVGLAIAAKKANIENKTWVFCGDGDIEEGISHEACSLAGTLKLGDLIAVYDSNNVTIEGDAKLAMADDTRKRFESYGWKVLSCDGHDYDDIDKTYRKAIKASAGQPVLIIATTHIGYGAPNKQDSADCHGAPLGAPETAALKKALGFDPEKSFQIGEDVYALFAERSQRMQRLARKWKRQNPDKAADAKSPEYLKMMTVLPKYEPGAKQIATRSAFGDVLNALADVVPELIGGSADLGPSNKSEIKGSPFIAPGDFSGRNIHFGIRELAMSAIANGITAFGGVRGYAATFFVFSDYCKPAIRLASLMALPTMWIFSHDSFYVGEDGPTHQPIEHLASLRCIPNLTVFRPADANETAYCFVEMLLKTTGPSCLLTTRQNVPVLEGVRHDGVACGAYIIYQSGPQGVDTVLFIASGSEVALCVDAAKQLAEEGRSVRVVSMPSQELFLAQKRQYRDDILPEFMKRRVIVEASTRFGWDRFRLDWKTTKFLTIDHFGESGPYKQLALKFGFTTEKVLEAARDLG